MAWFCEELLANTNSDVEVDVFLRKCAHLVAEAEGVVAHYLCGKGEITLALLFTRQDNLAVRVGDFVVNVKRTTGLDLNLTAISTLLSRNPYGASLSAWCAYGKVECNLLLVVFGVCVEASSLVCFDSVCEGCGDCLGAEQGSSARQQRRKLHYEKGVSRRRLCGGWCRKLLVRKKTAERMESRLSTIRTSWLQGVAWIWERGHRENFGLRPIKPHYRHQGDEAQIGTKWKYVRKRNCKEWKPDFHERF